jgi:hypothetical protein
MDYVHVIQFENETIIFIHYVTFVRCTNFLKVEMLLYALKYYIWICICRSYYMTGILSSVTFCALSVCNQN